MTVRVVTPDGRPLAGALVQGNRLTGAAGIAELKGVPFGQRFVHVVLLEADMLRSNSGLQGLLPRTAFPLEGEERAVEVCPEPGRILPSR